MEHELAELSLQKYAVNEFLSSHGQAIRDLASLSSIGITEDRLIQLNNILDNNEYKLAANQRKHTLPPTFGIRGKH